jgi:tetratricopeptide (TPR) repeat protein
LAYSNLGACYFENENYSDAEACFMKAYDIEKTNNNYDGIYYAASYLAKIYIKNHSEKAVEFLLDAKQSAEFINEDFYVLEATIALGDYYYDHKTMTKKALIEYLNARRIARNLGDVVDIDKIEERINDMKLRVTPEDFENLESKYG